MNMTKETIKKPDSFTNQAFSYEGTPLTLLLLASRIVTFVLNDILFNSNHSTPHTWGILQSLAEFWTATRITPICMGNTPKEIPSHRPLKIAKVSFSINLLLKHTTVLPPPQSNNFAISRILTQPISGHNFQEYPATPS